MLSLLLAAVMLLGVMPLTALADYVTGYIRISTVNITGIDVPVVGETPDYEVEVPSDAGYQLCQLHTAATDYINGVAWYDATNQKYMDSSEAFIDGHSYYPIFALEAKTGYMFASEGDITGTTNLFDSVSCAHFSDLEEGKYIAVLGGTWSETWTVQPVYRRAIEVMGGTAYNAEGEVIENALPGETVTLIANEPDFGWTFDMWQVMGDTVVDVADGYASTTTFVMPDSNIIIMSGYKEAEKVDVEQLTISLKGYYIDANVNCLQPTVTGNATLVTNTTTNLKYGLLSDKNGMPGTLLTSGAIAQSTNYWIGLILTPEFGYTLDNLTVDQITCSNAEKINLSTNSDGDTVLMIRLKTAYALLAGAKKITVTGGTAYNNLTAVTSAYPNLTIRLTADEDPDGRPLSHWNVTAGGVTIQEDEQGYYFIMPSTAVAVEAVYLTTITEISIEDIQIPEAGANPDYAASVPEGNGYNLYKDQDNSNNIGGLVWSNEDGMILRQYSVFEAGKDYYVSALVAAEDGFVFGQYVEASLNGETAGVSYVIDKDQTKYLSIYYTFTCHDWVDATCEAPKTCSICGETEGDPLGHSPGELDFDEGFHWHNCTVCGEAIEETLNEHTVENNECTYCDYCYLGDVDSWCLALGADLSVKFKVDVREDIRNTAKILLTVADKTVTYDLSQYNANPADNYYYYVSTNVSAAQMNEEIVIQIINGENTGVPRSYTVKQYAQALLADPNMEVYHKLINEMLNYGAAAQVFFDYDAENLVSDIITTDSVGTEEVPANTTEIAVTGSVSGIDFYGASLLFQNKIGIRYYFTVTGDIANYTFKANGVDALAVEKDGMYYIEVASINPQDLDESITVTVDDTLSVSYCPMNYIVRMNQKGSEELKALMKALYNYYRAAEDVACVVTINCENAAAGTALEDIEVSFLRGNTPLEHSAEWYVASGDELYLVESDSTLGRGVYELWIRYAGPESVSVIANCGTGQLKNTQQSADGTYLTVISYYFDLEN